MFAKHQETYTEQQSDDVAAIALEVVRIRYKLDNQLAKAASELNYMREVMACVTAPDVPPAVSKLAYVLIANSQQPEQGSKWRKVCGINTAKKLSELTGMSEVTARDALRQLVDAGIVSAQVTRARVDKNGREIDSADLDSVVACGFATVTRFAVSADVPKSMTAAATEHQIKNKARANARRAEARRNRALVEDIAKKLDAAGVIELGGEA